jgi:hypothetical protein
MAGFNFPCGETECPEEAQYELHIECVDGKLGEFIMPICFEHHVIVDTWLERDAKGE